MSMVQIKKAALLTVWSSKWRLERVFEGSGAGSRWKWMLSVHRGSLAKPVPPEVREIVEGMVVDECPDWHVSSGMCPHYADLHNMMVLHNSDVV